MHPPLEAEFDNKKPDIHRFIAVLERLIRELGKDQSRWDDVEFLDHIRKELIKKYPRRVQPTGPDPDEEKDGLPRGPLSEDHKQKIREGLRRAWEEKEAVKDGMMIEKELRGWKK